jgi:hypothetical protein
MVILGPKWKIYNTGIVLNVVNKTSSNTTGLTEKWKPMML